ncbi:MAG: type 1 glutamine amidotransferase [Actinomycetota bacterium]
MTPTSRRALVVIHDPEERASIVGRRLVHHGYSLERFAVVDDMVQPRSDRPFPDPGDYDLIVVMGAIYSVYDTAAIGSWIERELDFLRAADALGVPVFGICFGGQALAAAHGGRVVRAERSQIGWYPVPEADGIPGGPWMQWHNDRLEAPPEARVLSVDGYGVQAFVLGRNLGLQFHPEVDRAHLDAWLAGGGLEELATAGVDATALVADTDRCVDENRTNALVDWFLAEVAEAPGSPLDRGAAGA